MQPNSKYQPDYIDALKMYDDAIRAVMPLLEKSRKVEEAGDVYYLTSADEKLLEKANEAALNFHEVRKKYFG